MNVLFLQSPYSFLFNEVGKKLQNNSLKCYSLNFNLGDWYLNKNLNSVFLWQEIKKIGDIVIDKKLMEEILTIPTFYKLKKQKIKNQELSNKQKLYFYKYVVFLEKFIKKNKIECILMQNDTRWQHALAIYVAKKLGIKYFVFELGLFRPNTITMDSEGVNYNNSVPRKKEAYLNYNLREKIFNYKKISSNITERRRNLHIIIYIILYRLSEVLRVSGIENKKIRIRDYTRRFKKAYFEKKTRNDRNVIDGNYIFAPLQVSDDSQLLVHSDYNNMVEFMEEVISGVEKYRKKYSSELKLVFKEHPMDQGKVSYRDFYKKYKYLEWVYFLESGNTKKLVEESDLIITINSTVGLEAIERYKRVICMGRAFFAIDGIAKKSNGKNLFKDIKNVLEEEQNMELIENFINYLKYEYSIEGNQYFYNKTQIREICKKIVM